MRPVPPGPPVEARAELVRRVAFWSLFPFVAPQALYVRRTAPRFVAATGPDHGVVGEGPPLSVLGVGDSIIAGVGAGRHEAGLVAGTAAGLAAALGRRTSWRAVGQSGATTRTVLADLVPRLPAAPADVIGVSVGVNDITALERSPVFARRLGRLLDALRGHSPGALIVLAGLPPLDGFPLLPEPLRTLIGMRARTFDAIARRETSRRQRMLYVRNEFDPRPELFAADGYHPSPAAYAELAAMFAARIAETLQ